MNAIVVEGNVATAGKRKQTLILAAI